LSVKHLYTYKNLSYCILQHPSATLNEEAVLGIVEHQILNMGELFSVVHRVRMWNRIPCVRIYILFPPVEFIPAAQSYDMFVSETFYAVIEIMRVSCW